MERCNYCPLRSHLMNKNKRIVFGIVGGSLYMLGFIVDDTDILVQLITTVLMLCGLIMIILSFLLLANDLEAKETIKEYTEPFIDEYSEFDNCIFDDRQSGWYACLSIAEGLSLIHI